MSFPLSYESAANPFADEAISSSSPGDLDPEVFRRCGIQLVEGIADYLAHIEEYPVLPAVAPGEIFQQVPSHAPEQAEPLEQVVAEALSLLPTTTTHWQAPGYLAYFAVTASVPAMLGKLLEAALNPSRMLWRASPVATELEQVTVAWVRQLLGLPDDLFGMIHTNSAVLPALVAALEARDLHIRERGLAGRSDIPRLRLYASQQAHSSVAKAAVALGLGLESLCLLPVDERYRLRVDALEAAIQQDLQEGVLPVAVIATVGTTATTSVDPVAEIAALCQRYRLWLHVDGAYAINTAIVPELRSAIAGCQSADSLTVNPHKLLGVPTGCSLLYTRHPALLKRAWSIQVAYLAHTDGDGALDLGDYSLSLPHGMPALALWMTLRTFGRTGLIARIRECMRLARLVADWIDASPDFERLAPTPFSVVCFRLHPPLLDNEDHLNVLNAQLLRRINAQGRFFLSHTMLPTRHGDHTYTLRVAIGNMRTTQAHIEALWQDLQQAAHAILTEGASCVTEGQLWQDLQQAAQESLPSIFPSSRKA